MNKNYQNDEFLRKRKERQRKIRKRRAKIILIFFLVILLIIGAILSVTVLFPIKNITASGSKIYTPTQITEGCGIIKGENLIIASESRALSNLRTRLPFVEKVEFDRVLPDTLKIKVTDAKEYACYKIEKEYFSVGKDGWVLEKYNKKPDNLIVIISDKIKCKVGSSAEFSDDTVKELYTGTIDILNQYGIDVDYVDITDKISIKAKLEGRFIVNFGSSKDLEPKIKHLKAMIKEIDKNDSGKIDLSMWSRQNTQGAFTKTEIK